jgi:predicted XRE-type DNA-binding protein
MTQLGMTSKSGANVFADLGFAPAEAENLRMRAAMMRALIGFVRTSKLTPARAAKLLRASPRRISDLMSGKIYLFSIDNLVDLLAAAGLRVDLRVKKVV